MSICWLRRDGSGLRPDFAGAVFETLFGLIACTGLRVGEALSLRNMDVDLKAGMLSTHQTKFDKSRQVPMYPSTVDALRRYRWMRDLAGEPAVDDAAFFIGTRGRVRVMLNASRRWLTSSIEDPPKRQSSTSSRTASLPWPI